ncbi:MAG: hypothetical protein ACRDGF_04525 [Chloroflexota bacterium]
MIFWLLQPSVGLSLVLALAYTAGLHLAMRLGWRHLLRHWLVALAGMALGAGIAIGTGSQVPELGDMHVVEMSSVAIGFLLLAGVAASHTPEEAAPTA